MTNATSVAVSRDHSCAVRTDKTVVCWGYNHAGQLGNNSKTKSFKPVTVAINSVTHLTTGSYHTCAVTDGGVLKCWGYSGYDQLGDNAGASQLTPWTVLNLGATQRACAGYGHTWHTCALMTDATVKCWGHNGSSQLGWGKTNNATTP